VAGFQVGGWFSGEWLDFRGVAGFSGDGLVFGSESLSESGAELVRVRGRAGQSQGQSWSESGAELVRVRGRAGQSQGQR